jgi:small-conductance mechanosensitive channel
MAREELERLVAELPAAIADQAPVVMFEAFEPSVVRLRLSVRVSTWPDVGPTRSELIRRVQARLRSAGIGLQYEIP